VLRFPRNELAANLAAYGEHAVAAQIAALSESQYEHIGKLGFARALTGEHFALAACRAAVEVIEGTARDLRRPRREWSDVPSEYLQPDAIRQRIDARFDAYSGGEPMTTPKVIAALADYLTPRLPGFRYYKTRREFRSPFEGGHAYIVLERAHGVIALRFGVVLQALERVRASLFSSSTLRRVPSRASISAYSYNMGPQSPHWRCPDESTWPTLWSDGVEKASPEILGFIQRYALPFLAEHRSPEAIRRTQLEAPGKALGSGDWKTVFAVDRLAGNRAWLDADYALFKERAGGVVDSVRLALESDMLRVVTSWHSDERGSGR